MGTTDTDLNNGETLNVWKCRPFSPRSPTLSALVDADQRAVGMVLLWPRTNPNAVVLRRSKTGTWPDRFGFHARMVPE